MTSPPASPAPGSSCYVDRATAEQAVAMVLPMILPALGRDPVGSLGFLSIVILDPGVDPGQVAFDDALLLQHDVGDPRLWDADYGAFARAKARLSWQRRSDGTRVQAERPQLLQAGDTLLCGGIWLDGLTVAVSGAHPAFDEAFALAIAACLRALAKTRHAQALAGGATLASPA